MTCACIGNADDTAIIQACVLHLTLAAVERHALRVELAWRRTAGAPRVAIAREPLDAIARPGPLVVVTQR